MRKRRVAGAVLLAWFVAAPYGALAMAGDSRVPEERRSAAALGEGLNLSAQQRQMVRKYARGRPVKPVEVELEIGELLPEDMPVFRFHEKVVRHLPMLQNYRYFAIEGEVVLVDPRSNRIVGVLDEE